MKIDGDDTVEKIKTDRQIDKVMLVGKEDMKV